MPNHLSTLGIIHTAISIVAVLAGFAALFKEGAIDPKSTYGKAYVLLTLITCFTGFPIMKTGHPSPAHGLTILVLIFLAIGVYAKSIRLFGDKGIYIQVVLMSTTLFLSFVPAVNETLTRLPVSHPIAAGPDDPKVKLCLLVLFTVYLIGVVYQIVVIRSRRKFLKNMSK